MAQSTNHIFADPSHTSSAHYLKLALLTLLTAVLICTALMPRIATGESGASNFAVHWPTVLPYTLGLLLTSLFYVLAARALPPGQLAARHLKHGLDGLAVLLLLVLATAYPYHLTPALYVLHKTITFVLVTYELILAIVVVIIAGHTKRTLALLSLQGIGSLMLAATFFGAHVLFAGQAITLLSAGLVLITAIGAIEQQTNLP